MCHETKPKVKAEHSWFKFRVFFSYIGCHTKAKEPNLPYYLPITRESRDGFMPFLRGLVQCELQTALSWIWVWLEVSITYNDIYYVNWASIFNRNFALYLFLRVFFKILFAWENYSYRINTRMSQKFCDAQYCSSKCFYWSCKGDELHSTVRCQTRLILSKSTSIFWSMVLESSF